MSDTPRTDAAHDAWHGNAPRDYIWSLARDLERDLAAARERIAALEAERDEAILQCFRAALDRDQALAHVRELEAERDALLAQRDELRDEIVRFCP